MPQDRATKAALTAGQKQAEKVLASRRAHIQTDFTAALRAQVSTALDSPETAAESTPIRTILLAREAFSPTKGVLVAEGDSWFDYPGTDIVRLLEDEHRYDVESVAHRGDKVEFMAHNTAQFQDLARRFEKLILRNVVPTAVLLSGGGNDVAGDDFDVFLNHANSGLPHLNEAVIQGVIDQRLRAAYISLLRAITTICGAHFQQTIPIVLHGYDYPVPDGRGFFGGWWLLPGPWLGPGFEEKGYTQMAQRKAIMRTLIDRFNTMLASLTAEPEFVHVRYVDLRNTLSSGANYRGSWDNELHPTEAGFRQVTARIAAVL
jgi:lysophospholipase L1-like esterase